DAEINARLGRKVLDHESAADWRGINHYGTNLWNVDSRNVDGRNIYGRDRRHAEVEFMIRARHLVALRKFGLDVHGLAIATYAHGDCPAGRYFANQAAQLLHALDFLIVDGQDHIM